MWLGHFYPVQNLGHEKSPLPNISCPQAISNMGVEELAFCMILEVATEFPNFESLRFHEDFRGTTMLAAALLWLKSLY